MSYLDRTNCLAEDDGDEVTILSTVSLAERLQAGEKGAIDLIGQEMAAPVSSVDPKMSDSISYGPCFPDV